MRRTAAIVVVALALAGLAAVAGSTASAAPVPVVSPPPGGGPTTTQTFELGPFDLAAMGDAGGMDMAMGEALVPRPAGSFGLKGIQFDIVDDMGNSVPAMDVHLHHFVIAQVGADDPACPDRTVQGVKVKPLVGTGHERTPILFNDPYAVLVGQDDQWGATWHLMNMMDMPMTVKIRYTVILEQGADATNSRDLTPFWTDARTCPSGTVWDVPGNGGPGSVEVNSHDWTVPDDGIVVGVGGHLHDGGIDVTTAHQDGTTICTNTAMNDDMGNLMSITPCVVHDTVAKGEQLRVTARYDNSAPHAEVMGISVMYIWFGTQPAAVSSTTSSSSTSSTASTATTSSTAPSSTSTTVRPGTVAAAVLATPRFTG